VVSVTTRPRFAPVPIGQEAGWASEPVWTQRLEEKSFLKLWGAPNWGDAVGPCGGGGVVCIRDIFILDEIWTQDKYIFW
jgi:hypothetical protein